jgi:hypothetical protein
MAHEILGTAPELLAFAEGRPIDLSERRIEAGDLDERRLLGLLRELHERVRPRLHEELARAS